MENKQVGWLIIGLAGIMATIVLIFNRALKEIVGQTCVHGPSCTMYDTIGAQTLLSLSIIAIVIVIGLAIMYTKPKEKIVIQKVNVVEKKKKLNLKELEKDEKKVIDFLIEEGKAVFQKDLMEKMEIGKVKTTRLLDKLEAKQLIERKRRGMNNIVVLRD